MIHRNMLKSKKAISPILATLLLIVIAVAAIVITYAWITTYMGTTTQQAGFLPYKANVAFDNTTAETIIIDIGNSGTSSGQISAIYIGLSSSTLASQTFTSATIDAGSIESFTITYDYDPETTYYFKVVPASGAALEFQATSPSA